MQHMFLTHEITHIIFQPEKIATEFLKKNNVNKNRSHILESLTNI